MKFMKFFLKLCTSQKGEILPPGGCWTSQTSFMLAGTSVSFFTITGAFAESALLLKLKDEDFCSVTSGRAERECRTC